MRAVAATDLSRLTLEPCVSEPRFVRRSVSGDTPTLNDDPSNAVRVRHAPLTLILSPSEASERISAQSEMVREVPLPPLALESRLLSSVTAW